MSEIVIPYIEGKIQNAKCCFKGILFTNLEPLTDSTLKLENLDVYYSARLKNLI